MTMISSNSIAPISDRIHATGCGGTANSWAVALTVNTLGTAQHLKLPKSQRHDCGCPSCSVSRTYPGTSVIALMLVLQLKYVLFAPSHKSVHSDLDVLSTVLLQQRYTLYGLS